MDLMGLRTALLVIDMQNGFCHPQGSYAKAGLPAARLAAPIGACRRLIDAARTAGVPVIYTRAFHEADFSDLSPRIRESPSFDRLLKHGIVVKGTWDYEVLDELRPQPQDIVVDKMRFSAFISAGMGITLSALGTRNLIVCGVTTAMCVESTVRDASQSNYRTFVVRDGVAEVDQREHEAALAIMERGFAWVVDSEEAVQALLAAAR